MARNSFFLRSPLVRPTISPSSTVKSDLSSGVTQPVKSLPLKSGRNCAGSSAFATGHERSCVKAQTARQKKARATYRVSRNME